MGAALLYILAVLAANLTATAFLPFPVFGQVAVGTLIFGLTFTQRDRMHRLGRPFVYKVIALSAVLNLGMMASYLTWWGAPLVDWLTAQGWEWLATSAEYLQESGWRVLLASFLAIIVAETADTEVYHRVRHLGWYQRVLRSNTVSIPVDSVVFNLIAFAGVFAWPLWLSIVFGEIVTKFAVGALYATVRPRQEKDTPDSFRSQPKAV